jgi:hypothetical protein
MFFFFNDTATTEIYTAKKTAKQHSAVAPADSVKRTH